MLTDDAILVTGASRGLGREMALRFSAEGARVALLARDERELETVADEAETDTLVVPADVTDTDEIEGAVSRTVEEFGHIDVLVNNAGVGLLSLSDETKSITNISDDEWETVIDVNLSGAFRVSRAVLPFMVERGRGNVINVSSILGAQPEPQMGPYVCSKFGLEGLTQVLAFEHAADGINVNSLFPAARVETGFWDHLPDEERSTIRDPDYLNDAAVLLAAQGPEGLSGHSMAVYAWEAVLG